VITPCPETVLGELTGQKQACTYPRSLQRQPSSWCAVDFACPASKQARSLAHRAKRPTTGDQQGRCSTSR